MKYLLIVVFSLFVGFFAGYLFYDATVDQNTSHPVSVIRSITEYRLQPNATDSDNTSAVTVGLDLDAVRDQKTVFDKLLVAYQIAAAAAPGDLESLLEETISIRDPLYDANIAGIFLEKWTALDPEAALDFVIDHPQMNQEYFRGHVLTSWARHDPEAALDYFRQMDNAQIKIAVGSRLLDDPMLDSGLTTEVERELGPVAQGIVRQMRLRRIPPQDAFEQALMSTSRQRTSELMAAAMRWATTDPEGALERIVNLPNQSEQDYLLRTVLTQLARADPDRALELRSLYAPGDDKLEEQILRTFAQSDPVRALPYVERYTNRTSDADALSALLGAWVQRDPAAALAYAETLPRSMEWTTYQIMAARYASAYPDEALNWALGLDPALDHVKKITLASIGERRPELAEQVIDRINDAELRDTLIQQIAANKSRQDISGAIAWIERNTTPNSAARQNALAAVAQQVSRREPERALPIVARLPPGPVKDNAGRSLAFMWAMREPDRVEEIIGELDLDAATAQQLRNRRDSAPSRRSLWIPPDITVLNE